MKLIDRNKIREKVASRRYRSMNPESREKLRKRVQHTPHLDEMFRLAGFPSVSTYENIDTFSEVEKLIWGAYPERKTQVAMLSQCILPVVRFTRHWLMILTPSIEGALYYIEHKNPFDHSFVHNPRAKGRALNLKRLCDITTRHKLNGSGFFMASVAEVIAQIPEDVLDHVIAFEIIDPLEAAVELNSKNVTRADGGSVAKTRLYGRA